MRAIHFSLNLYSSIKTEGATVSSGQIDLASDLYQEYIYFMGSETLPSACYILSDESWGRKRFLLPFTYFPTNLVYLFTLYV